MSEGRGRKKLGNLGTLGNLGNLGNLGTMQYWRGVPELWDISAFSSLFTTCPFLSATCPTCPSVGKLLCHHYSITSSNLPNLPNLPQIACVCNNLRGASIRSHHEKGANGMAEHETPSVGAPILITASDIPDVPLCCQEAHERGYRRGYQQGYRSALWDLGAVVRLTDALWTQVEQFLYGDLAAWTWRGVHGRDPHQHKENGPRFRWHRRAPGKKGRV
jgi:hypothetical protein